MSLIKGVDGELAGMAAGVGRVVQLAAEAANAASQIASRAARTRFAGIAQRVVLIQRALQELQGQASAAGTLVDEARTPGARAPEQMSPEDTAKTLGPLTQQIDGIHAALGGLIAKVGEIQRQTVAALQGGQPGPMLQRLEAIRQVVLAVVQRCNGAKQQIETALAEARQTGTAGRLTAGVAVPIEGSAAPRVQPPPAVEAIGRALPRRATVRSPTTGEFNGERISSQEDPTTVADLRPFRAGGWPTPMISHVESHVAARMRRQGLAEGEVVLNNITCGNRGFDQNFPETCERYLPSLLPQGSRLTVWATTDGGTTWWNRTYVGTGERIRP